MRLAQFAIAYVFAGASAALACLFGLLSATGYFAIAKALGLALVAIGGCHGPAWCAELRRSHGLFAAIFAGLATAACLAVTLASGLGTISGGGAELRAERTKASGDRRRADGELSRLQGERGRLTISRPADAVAADLATSRASPLYKASEGCEPERIVGKQTREHCRAHRQLEGEHATAARGDDLDAKIARIVAQLGEAPPDREADPQAHALAILLQLPVELVTALYALGASLALELAGMVAMMVARSPPRGNCNAHYKLLEVAPEPEPDAKPNSVTAKANSVSAVRIRPQRPAPVIASPAPPAPSAAVVPIGRGGVFGSIRKYALARLKPADGERLEMRAAFEDYKRWCAEGGLTPAPLAKFLDEIEATCETATIGIVAEGDKVYCVGVTLAA